MAYTGLRGLKVPVGPEGHDSGSKEHCFPNYLALASVCVQYFYGASWHFTDLHPQNAFWALLCVCGRGYALNQAGERYSAPQTSYLVGRGLQPPRTPTPLLALGLDIRLFRPLSYISVNAQNVVCIRPCYLQLSIRRCRTLSL